MRSGLKREKYRGSQKKKFFKIALRDSQSIVFPELSKKIEISRKFADTYRIHDIPGFYFKSLRIRYVSANFYGDPACAKPLNRSVRRTTARERFQRGV